MRSFGFLLSRRWVLFALVVGLLASLAWWLGGWQFDRLEERRDRNAVIERNLERAPAPAAQVLAPGRPVAALDQWRVVSATGTYAVEDTVLVRYRSREGQQGVDVVVPLVTTDGTALLVDRGFVATDGPGVPTQVPAPPPGEVTVTGYVRIDGSGDSTRVSTSSTTEETSSTTDGTSSTIEETNSTTGISLTTRAISSGPIGKAIDRTVYGGFVDLRSEDPGPAEPLQLTETPELDSGPHFFYGLQWWFFGLLALVGFGYLAYKERSMPPSTGSMEPDTNDAAGESRKAAALPNSSGSP